MYLLTEKYYNNIIINALLTIIVLKSIWKTHLTPYLSSKYDIAL